jgi:YD repeat-containing protein
VYTFTVPAGQYLNAASWNTAIDWYQGSSTNGGSMLLSQGNNYAYATNFAPVDGANTPYLVPTTITTTNKLDDVGLTAQTQTTLDSVGVNPVTVGEWDYFSGSAPSTPTRQTSYSYYSGSSWPSEISVTDGSGNLIEQTTYSYDQATPTTTSGLPNHNSVNGTRFNLTTVSQWINSSGTTLNAGATYDDAGTALTSSNPNGTTTYGHDNTDTFVTSTTPPTPPSSVILTSKATYDPSSGLLTSTTDPNDQTTTYKTYDWAGRALEIDYPDGGKTTFAYTPTQSGVYQYQNASTFADTETQYDSYGREGRIAVANGQNSNPWYQQDTCYDQTGRVSF